MAPGKALSKSFFERYLTLWITGSGSEVMRRIAAPMVGGMVSSTALTLLVIPALYALVKGWGLPHGKAATMEPRVPGTPHAAE